MNGETAPAEARVVAQAVKDAKRGDWDAVEGVCGALAAEQPTGFRISFLLALSAFARDDIALAVEHAKRAFALEPGNSQVAELLAIFHALAGDTNQATFYVKMASVATDDPEMKEWLPEGLPSLSSAYFGAREQPFLQAALTASSHREWGQAEHWYRQHLAFHPKDINAHIGLGNVLMIRGALRSAVSTLRAARHNVPNDPRLASLLGSALTHVGAIAQGRALHDWAVDRSDDPLVHAVACTDRMFDPDLAPDAVIERFQEWGRRFGVSGDSFPPCRRNPNKQRLTVGYVVGSIDRTEFAPALARLFVRHDPQRFRIVGFGLGRLSDTHNTTFQQCVEGWLDIQGVDPLTFGSMVMAEDVDVLVDLCGFVDPLTLRAFGARMAPVQLHWLGTPAGSGLAEVDGMITDGFLDPDGTAPLAEPLIRLDSGSLVAELPSAVDLTREGSDDESPLGPVFAADVLLAELNIPTVAAWAEILHSIPNAMLLLRDHDLRTEENVSQLIEMFGNYGIAHRVEIVSVEGEADLFRMADVGLVPFNTARLEPIGQALGVGTPIVCLAGEGRYRRRAGSLLHSLGLGGDLIAADRAAYRDMAVTWAVDVDRRTAFGAGLEARLAVAPLADLGARAAELERIYEDLWRKAVNQG